MERAVVHEEGTEARHEHPGGICEHFDGQACLLAGVHADPALCTHCLEDVTGLFRARLSARKAQQDLRERLGAGAPSFPCDRFALTVDATFCAECKRNPALKQFLSSSRGAHRALPCIRRREQAGEREVKCCGGKTKMVPAYRCAGHVEAKTERDCSKCPEYEIPSPRPLPKGEGTGALPEGEGVACASWDSLYAVHAGQTALVLACGPSVQLPGEDPGPDTVDPRGVDADVVISTNWAWKWYADIIHYQVSYDPTPCQGWRPGHIKLLTAARKAETMKMLAQANVYCFFPTCDYGEIVKGRPLPCSRNSGYAALAFAAYAGCSLVKVLGMDFGARVGADGKPARMHFYHEGKTDVDRRVRSFGRQKERVQGDLAKLLAAVRATGATVENLSPRSELDWGTA